MNTTLNRITSILAAAAIALSGVPAGAAAAPVTTPEPVSFGYTGAAQEYVVPENGVYLLEAWGASGGGAELVSNGTGTGGCTKVWMNLYKGQVLYVYVGEAGTLDGVPYSSYRETFNGGAGTVWGDNTCTPAPSYWELEEWNCGSGGGATDFRTVGGAWDSEASLASRIVVAGGGGGLSWTLGSSGPNVPDTDGGIWHRTRGNNDNVMSGVAGSTKIRGRQERNYRDYEGGPENLNCYVPGGGGGSASSGAATLNGPGFGAGGGRYFTEESLEQEVITGGNVGNGKAKVSYVSPIYKKVVFECTTDSSSGAIGTVPVAPSDEDGVAEVKWEYGTENEIPAASKEHWTFLYWEDINDSSKKYYAGDTLEVSDTETLSLVAHYVYDGNAVFYQKQKTDADGRINHYIHVNNIDDGIEKYVQFLASRDGGATYDKVNTNGTSFSEADVYRTYSAGQSSTFKVKSQGRYMVDLYGGRGADATNKNYSTSCPVCGRNHYDMAGKGALGGHETAIVNLKYNDTANVNIGTNASGRTGGTNGGGSAAYYIYTSLFGGHTGWHGGPLEQYYNNLVGEGESAFEYVTSKKMGFDVSSGGGGGASDFRINSKNIVAQSVVAAGGGGAAYVSAYYYGDDNAFNCNGTSTYSESASNYTRLDGRTGTNNARRLDGGGGGGYIGGGGAGRSRIQGAAGENKAIGVNGRPVQEVLNSYGSSNNPRGSITYLDTDTKILAMDADFLITPYDTIAPTVPSKLRVKTVDDKFRVGWTQSSDRGEKYLYKAEIFSSESDEKLYDCEDRDTGALELNIDSTSGVRGYYYIYTSTDSTFDVGASIETYIWQDPTSRSFDTIDAATSGTSGIVAGQKVWYAPVTAPYHELPAPNESTVYVYVCAVDFAGNLSDTAKFELKPGYNIDVNPNGGEYKGSSEPTKEHAAFGSPVDIPNPVRDGFEFMGWDISGMDSEVHYYDSGEATTDSPSTTATSLDHTVVTPEIDSFMDLRHSDGDVSFNAVWKDTKAPALDETSGPGSGIAYVNTDDGTNPDSELYATFVTEDGSEYTPGTWTNKSVKMTVSLFDGTGFSNVAFRAKGERVNGNDNTPAVSFDASAAHRVDYGAGGAASASGVKDPELENAGISVKFDVPTANSITTRQRAKVEAVFTNTGRYSGEVGATDNASNANYLASLRNWLLDTSDHSSKFGYGVILIDKEAPVATVEYSTTDWTNEDVTVTIHATDSRSGLDALAYSWDHGATWTSDNTHVFSEMTADHVYVRDAVGNWLLLGYKVGNIDKYEPWTEDMYYVHSNAPELHEWVNTPGGIVLSYTSNDRSDPGSASVASGVDTMVLYASDENYVIGEELARVSAPYIPPSMDIADGEDFVSHEEPLTLEYVDDTQGTTYYVLETYDRAGNVTTVELVYKWDVTPPALSDPFVHQTSLDEFSEAEVEAAIAGELYCYFNYMVDDNNRAEAAPKMTYENDSSGIAEVVIVLMNSSDNSESRELRFSAGEIEFLNNWVSKNNGAHEELKNTFDAELYEETGATEVAGDDGAILSGYVASKINTYEAFPTWAAIDWVVYAIDRAGNSTNDNSTSLANIAGEEIKNFSIKTVVYSDEQFDNGDSLNILQNDEAQPNFGNNVAYFRTGDVGHTVTWTVGYVEEFSTDFGGVGSVSVSDIEDGRLLSKYNLGVDSAQFKRKYLYTIGREVPSGRAKSGSVPYATRYDLEGWWDYPTKMSNGTSVRISPYYELQPTGELKSDGTPKYQSETHTYKATARKGPASNYWEDSSSGMYVIWDAASSEVHHRITHERHGTVVQTTE